MTERDIREEYGYAKPWYDKNVTIRESLESDWRDAAALTLPYIFPNNNQDQTSILPSPYNSIGPAAVNSLAAKLLLALLPPTGVFFRLLPDKEAVKDVEATKLKQLDKELSKVEQDVVEYINQKALRVPTYEAIKLLIVTGNTLIYKVPKGGIKVFSPYQYVVQRDYEGNLLTACIKEIMSADTLPKDVEALVEEGEDSGESNVGSNEKEEVEVYTMIVRESRDKYIVWQEINKVIIPGTIKPYTEDKLPYRVLRWTTINNEDYGRGLVQQYLGDLRSLEGLSQTIVEGAGIAAMHLFGLRPGSTLKVEDLNNAQNGEFVLGDLEREVSTLQVNKGGDLQVPMNMMQSLEQRIARAFMMMSGQVRDSERTTATEVRATAAELESTLGGVFSVLASEFQTPLITLILQELNPEVLKFTEPSITTGVAAISRERDFQNLNVMVQTLAQLGPEAVMKYLNISEYLSQVATSLGMDPELIVKTQEQIQQEEQAAKAAQMEQLGVQQGAQMAQDIVKEQSKQGGQ